MSNNESLNLITEQFCVPFTSENCGYGVCNAEGNFCFCEPGYVHGKFYCDGFHQISFGENSHSFQKTTLQFICALGTDHIAYLNLKDYTQVCLLI